MPFALVREWGKIFPCLLAGFDYFITVTFLFYFILLIHYITILLLFHYKTGSSKLFLLLAATYSWVFKYNTKQMTAFKITFQPTWEKLGVVLGSRLCLHDQTWEDLTTLYQVDPCNDLILRVKCRIGEFWPKLGSLPKKYKTYFNRPPTT